MRKIRVLVSLIFIVIGTIGMLLTIGDYKDTRNKQFQHVIENNHVDSIYINDRVASIEVLPISGPDIIIAWEEDVNRKEDHVTINEKGNQLEVKRQRKSSLFIIPRFNMKQQNMKIYLPEDNLTTINIKTTVGSVLVNDVEINELNIQSDIQRVVIKNVQASSIRAKSSVGSILIENSTGEMTAESSVGSIDVDITEVTGDMNLKSDVGSVTLTLDEEPEDIAFLGSSDLGSLRIFGERTSIPAIGSKYQVYVTTDVGKVEVKTR